MPEETAAEFRPEMKTEPVPATSATRSASIGKIVGALAKAQGEIQNARKESLNPTFRMRYADLASVWNACREALSKQSLVVVQTPGQDARGLHVDTLLAHDSGEWMSGRLYVEPGYTDKDGQFFPLRDPQSMGSAITYARRYALAAMVGVAPEDDDAETAAGEGQEARFDHDSNRQAKGGKKAGPPKGAGDDGTEWDWRNVMNFVGKPGGPIHKKRLGELSEDNLKWLLKMMREKNVKKLNGADKRLLDALLRWEAETQQAPEKPAKAKAPAKDSADAKKNDGNAGVNLSGLADNLDFHQIPVPLFLAAIRAAGWSKATEFEQLTDEQAAWFMENMDQVETACEREREDGDALK